MSRIFDKNGIAIGIKADGRKRVYPDAPAFGRLKRIQWKGPEGGLFLPEHLTHRGIFALNMGFTPKVCRVRRPQTKGKVERLVQYVKNNFLPGRTFTGLEYLNLQALDWCKKADSKVHGTTGKIPLEEMSGEVLRSLPEKAVRNKYRWEIRKVTKDGFASFDGARYGIPWQYAGQEVRVRICGDTFEAYDGEVRIAVHKVEYASGRIVWLKGQYQWLAEHNGLPTAAPFARLNENVSVETRSLDIYDQVSEVASHG